MRIIYLSFLLFVVNFIGFSQNEPSCDWSFTMTASNATIAIQQENFDNMLVLCFSEENGAFLEPPISNIDCPVWVGVFYFDNNGNLACGN